MLAEKIAAKIMQIVLRTTLVLMVAGLILKLLKINETPETVYVSIDSMLQAFTTPNGYLLFATAAGLLLFSPILVSIGTGIAFIKDGNKKMALVSFGLFAILAVSIVVRLFI